MPKKGAWTVCRFKGGLGKKEGDGIFEGGGGGVDTPMHTMLLYYDSKSNLLKERNICTVKIYAFIIF